MAMILFGFPGLPNIICIFCGRKTNGSPNDGNISYNVGDTESDVDANRVALFDSLSTLGLICWRECHQAHGDKLLVDPPPSQILAKSDSLAEADGMMTSHPGLGLMIKTADCQPILLADTSGTHIMALHVGWRGNRINFPATAIKAFCSQYQIETSQIFAVRGPSLGPTASEFVNFDSEWGPDFNKWFYQKTETMDLWALTRHQLEKAGVPSDQIYNIDICTYLNAASWFSYRRDKQTGRQASLIWINPAKKAGART